jgi:hypothetical protein
MRATWQAHLDYSFRFQSMKCSIDPLTKAIVCDTDWLYGSWTFVPPTCMRVQLCWLLISSCDPWHRLRCGGYFWWHLLQIWVDVIPHARRCPPSSYVSGLGLPLRVFVMVKYARCGVISPTINLVLVILIRPLEISISKASRHLVAKPMKHGWETWQLNFADEHLSCS